jgi:starch synthase
MRVLSVASECVPFVKTGGLADVVGALPLRWRAGRGHARAAAGLSG